MLYTIIISNNETQNIYNVECANAREAHEHASTLTQSKTDTIRTYATTTDASGNILTAGVQAGALTVVKRTTANMIVREGGEIQHRLYNECRKPTITDTDVMDCISVAQLAIIESIMQGEPIDEQYHQAYLALNRYLRSTRNINLSATAMRTVYIEDIDGEIISVNKHINIILKNGERYTPQADEDENESELIHIIDEITSTLTPTQINVLSYLARGYSERQIADAMKRSKTTIHEHITFIRKKAVNLYPNGYKAK